MAPNIRAVLTLPEAKVVNPELYEIFTMTMWGYLSTFMANLSDDMTASEKLSHALNLFFDTDHVTIDTYRAVNDFKLIGELKEPETTYWQPGENLREVKTGEFLIVRIDSRIRNTGEIPYLDVQILKNTFDDHDDRRQFKVNPVDFYKLRGRNLIHVSSY